MLASSVINAVFGSYDLRTSKQWRDEDLVHWEQKMQWRYDQLVRSHEWRVADIERSLRREKREHEHLLCEARAEQLHAVSEQCVLLGGFTVIALSNLDIPANVHPTVLFFYGTSAALVCILLILATVMCTMLSVAVARYAGHYVEVSVKKLDITQLEQVSPFASWWLKTCEREQMRAYKLMGFGIALFFFYLSMLSWVQYHNSVLTATTINVLCLLTILAWQMRLASKWRYLLMPPTDPAFQPSPSLRLRMDLMAQTTFQEHKPSVSGVLQSPTVVLSPAHRRTSPAYSARSPADTKEELK